MSRIMRLQVQGFKAIEVVDITPPKHVVRIAGNNEQGKTSVLDAIFAAIGGADAAPLKPVRTGEEYAIIRLDIGNSGDEAIELRATRYFSADGEVDRLKLENADGATYGAAQTKLDDLVGSITFDPLAFANMSDKDQVAELLRLVPLSVDLGELAAKDKADYTERRDVNRDAKALVARIEAIPTHADLPEKAPDKASLIAELEAAGETNSAIERDRMQRAEDRRSVERGIANAAEKQERAKALREEANRLDREAAEMIEAAETETKRLDGLPAPTAPVDTAALRQRIEEAEGVIAKLADRDRKRALLDEFEGLKEKSDALTAAMAARSAERKAALEAADMPIEGLSLAVIEEELRVTFKGEPFSQSSAAQRIRVSTALAMAANPKLRVCRIKDGSLLDPSNLEILSEMAREHDFQIWLEVVGEEGSGIIMQAGKVKGAPDPEKLEPPKRRAKKGEGDADEGDAAGDGEGAKPGKAAAPERKKPVAMTEINTPVPGQLDL